MVNIDVFNMKVDNQVVSKNNAALIVNINNSSYNLSEVKLLQQYSELDNFQEIANYGYFFCQS